MAYLYKHKTDRAFTLVELMVSISIMLLVMTVMLTRQSAFNGAVLLRNQAYEVAFTIRQAQLLAVSGKDTSVRTYGVYFNTATPQEYVMFADTTGNGYSDGEQIGLTGSLDSRFQVSAVANDGNNPPRLSVMFERPNFDLVCAPGCSSGATIDIRRKGTSGSGAGEVRVVEVTKAGQISVKTK